MSEQKKRDPEIDALIAIIKLLEPFSDEERARMLRYISVRMLAYSPQLIDKP